MLERLVIAVALLAMGYCAYCATRTYLLWRATKQAPQDPLLASVRKGVPAVLYFTTPTCAPCKYAQRPALGKLQTQLGEAVQVIQVDATEDPDAASRWGVQTVPTTYVLDGDGKPMHVNHGVADVNKLMKQLGTASI